MALYIINHTNDTFNVIRLIVYMNKKVCNNTLLITLRCYNYDKCVKYSKYTNLVFFQLYMYFYAMWEEGVISKYIYKMCWKGLGEMFYSF